MFKKFLFLLLSFQLAFSMVAEEISIYKQIGNEHIKPSELDEARQEKPKPEEPTNAFNQKPDFTIKPLSKGQRKIFVYNDLLKDNGKHNSILTKDAWLDLELYKHADLVSIIDRTRTTLGQAVLAKMMSAPIVSIKELTQRQDVIKTLLSNPDLLHKYDRFLGKIADAEPIFFTLWQEESAINKQFVTALSPFASNSKNTGPHEFAVRFGQITQGSIYVSMAYALIAFPFIWATRGGHGLGEYIRNNPITSASSLMTLIYIPLLPLMLKQQKFIFVDAANYLQTKLIHAATAINSAKRIHALMADDELFKETVHGFDAMDNLLTKVTDASEDMQKLLEQLETNTFKGKASFFSITGRILSTHNLMKELKDQFRDLLEAVGSIDAYVSAAKLYKEHEGKNLHYCFATFIEQHSPYISLTDVWNPQVGQRAIPNSIAFGKPHARNMILTGQNTAGKTTVLKAITFAILMSQVFGFGPGREITLTPFTIINTHVNVNDDLAAGRSLFANEVHRAKELLERVVRCNKGEFSFTIIDEMFRGTGPQHAEVLSYKYAKRLAKYPNAIVIESTHYPKMVNLEQETNGVYKNHKMDIIKEDDGSLTRPYKVEEGYTLVNIAEDILKEEGLLLDDE